MITAEQIKTLVPTEADLCDHFMREFNALPGWTCYPETGGFDIVVAHESGRQIGVQAKLQLNAKVAEQIMPSDGWHRYNKGGPDHRLVIVRSITDANAGIARMLEMLGVAVWSARFWERYTAMRSTWDIEFQIKNHLWGDIQVEEPADVKWGHTYVGMFDWNPSERVELPEVVPTVPAGVPAPVQMTPWKQAAMRVLARLRVDGYITAKEIAMEGCSPSTWTQRWLTQGPARGTWIETDAMPAFDKQHPELYAVALERARAAKEAAKP
jgi:hypothetical protein